MELELEETASEAATAAAQDGASVEAAPWACPGEVFVGIDTAKARNAVAVADGDRNGEVRYLGKFDKTSEAVAKLVRKLAERYERLHFCYEAGPTATGCIASWFPLGTRAW